MSAPADLSSRALIARVWREYLKPRWPGLAVALLCAGLIAALNTKLLQMIQPAFDDIVTNRNPGAVIAIPLTIIGQALGRPLPVILGKDAFNALVVDVDFPNRRIAFHEIDGGHWFAFNGKLISFSQFLRT